jgi:hypothetical protein
VRNSGTLVWCACGTYGKEGKIVQGFDEETRKRPFGRTRFTLKDNMKTDLQDVGLVGVDLVYLAEGGGT